MIHRVTSRRYRLGWTVLPILLGLLLQAFAPFSAGRQWSERYVSNWIVAEGWRGLTTDEGAIVPQVVCAPTTAGAYSPGRIQRRHLVAPRVQLPRSAYGDARWCPISDRIVGPTGEPWAPMRKPSPWYFLGTLHSVSGGTRAALNSAVNAAADTDIVELASNVTVSGGAGGSIIFPNRGTAGTVLVRSAGVATIAAGVRAVPADFASAYKVTSGNSTPPFYMAQGASGWFFHQFMIRNGRVGNAPLGAIMVWQAQTQTQVAHVPSRLFAHQCYWDGDWQTLGEWGTQRALVMDGEYQRVENCSFTKCTAPNSDSQSILSYNAIGKALVENNFLEGASENIYSGGASTSMGAREYNADFIFRRNHVPKNLAWMGVSSTTAARKNFYEVKNGFRHVYEGNVCEHHDGQGQPQDISFGAKPQTTAEQAWVRTEDMWVRYCIFRDSQGTTGAGAGAGDTGLQAVPGSARIHFSHNLVYSPRSSVNRFLVGVAGNGYIPDLAAEFNTWDLRQTTVAVNGQLTTNVNKCPGLYVCDNVWFGDVRYSGPRCDNGGGVALLNNCAGAGLWTFARNTMYTTAPGCVWEAGVLATTNKRVLTPIGFANVAGGDYTIVDTRLTTYSASGGPTGCNFALLSAAISGVV